MVICMEIVQDMYFQHITDWGLGCWDYRVCLFKPIIFTDQRHISEVFAVSKPLQRQRRVNVISILQKLKLGSGSQVKAEIKYQIYCTQIEKYILLHVLVAKIPYNHCSLLISLEVLVELSL